MAGVFDGAVFDGNVFDVALPIQRAPYLGDRRPRRPPQDEFQPGNLLARLSPAPSLTIAHPIDNPKKRQPREESPQPNLTPYLVATNPPPPIVALSKQIDNPQRKRRFVEDFQFPSAFVLGTLLATNPPPPLVSLPRQQDERRRQRPRNTDDQGVNLLESTLATPTVPPFTLAKDHDEQRKRRPRNLEFTSDIRLPTVVTAVTRAPYLGDLRRKQSFSESFQQPTALVLIPSVVVTQPFRNDTMDQQAPRSNRDLSQADSLFIIASLAPAAGQLDTGEIVRAKQPRNLDDQGENLLESVLGAYPPPPITVVGDHDSPQRPPQQRNLLGDQPTNLLEGTLSPPIVTNPFPATFLDDVRGRIHRPDDSISYPSSILYLPASGTFVVIFDTPGVWSYVAPPMSISVKIELYGAGGSGNDYTDKLPHDAGGGGGAYLLKTRAISAGTALSGLLGAGGATSGFSGAPGAQTTATQDVLVAHGGNGASGDLSGAGGTASGGDTNINGEAGGAVNIWDGGACLGPGGGARQTINDRAGNAPGGGGAGLGAGANGRVILTFTLSATPPPVNNFVRRGPRRWSFSQ